MILALILACGPTEDTGEPVADETGDDTGSPDSAGDTGCATPTSFYVDGDGDGYGAGDPVVACLAPAGTARTPGDCDDADPATSPGAAEVCDGEDDDCDGAVDDVTSISVDGATHATVQAALDAAGEGAVVELCGGPFGEALTASRTVTLRGAVTIDAGGAGPAVTVTGGTFRAEGLTLTGGLGGDGGGVAAAAGASVELVDCVVNGNAATNGGGVYAGSLRLERTSIASNTADHGGGIYVPAGGSVTLADATITGNGVTASGGGAYLDAGATLDATGTAWVENRSDVYAAGVWIADGGAFADSGGTFEANVAVSNAGALHAQAATVTLDGTTFTGNTGEWGGAAFLYGATVEARGATFRSNVAELGGALYVYMGSSVVIEDGWVEDNVGEAGGGARVKSDAFLSSVNTGWGVGSADNSADDVDISGGETYGDFGDAATFTCSAATGLCE